MVDDDGNIQVVDMDRHCIQRFTSNGKLLTTIGKFSSAPSEFWSPVDVGIYPHNKKLYVADQGNHYIQVLNPDHTMYRSFGCMDSDDGQFDNPTDVS